MYLKSLRLKGFKSFAKPVEIELNSDISAIVGPNGSGKSNIIDAIRWVLGEQRSKSLRGKNMEDVIFSGTDTVPAQNVAEVCLTLDNSDGFLSDYPDEVAVTRRLYRSGESVYQINHRNARLKDIQMIFADTGLGRNGYSIVGQGSIENIVSASPQRLREIVEEAVGIVGYKIRKQEAERKLAQTQDNMDRVNDILEELARQHGPLKRQAQKARDYLDLHEQLRAVDYCRFAERETELTEKLAATEQAIADAEAERSETKIAIHDADAAYQKRRNQNRTAAERRAALQAQAETLRQAHADALAERRVREEKARHLADETKRLTQTKAADEQQLDTLLSEQKTLEAGSAALDKKLVDAKAERETTANQTPDVAAGDDATARELAAENDRLRKVYIDRRVAAEDAATAVRKAREQRDQVANALSLSRSKRAYLKDMQASYQDYYPGIRLIMSGNGLRREVRANVAGPVGSLIRFPEKLTRAIDTALGARTQNVVVRDVATANACIALLKKRHAGRETFLPLDNLRYRLIAPREKEAICAMAGVIGIASELVRCEDAVRPAVDSLLGRTIVTRDFDAARGVRGRFTAYTIVTLSGEVFYPGGAIVGGETKNKTRSPLVKNAEIAHFDREIADNEKRLADAETALAEREKTAKTAQDAMATAKAALDKSEQALWQDKARQRDAVLTARQQIADAVAKVDIAIARIEAEKQNADRQLDAIAARIRAARATLENDSAKLAANAKAREALTAEMAAGEDAIAKAAQAVEDFKQQMADFESENERLGREIAETERKIQNLHHDLIAQNDHLNQLEMTKTRVVSVKDNLEERMANRYGVTALMITDWLKAHDTQDIDASKERQRALSEAITALGHVNLDAIDSFDEIDRRYRFVKKQYDDLVAGKRAVETVIADLYASMQAQFAAGFAKLQTAFSEIFQILFEGGHARLSYEDPDHILESGILLAAQPPGKHLKQLSLLSGGEKSMTAIALLFAFLKLNPSPFCVIDEVDAALDDHNIDRFTNYLKTISGRTQFILITHRKTTLAVCDTIYGISMAKSGVSKLVSIHVSDYTSGA